MDVSVCSYGALLKAGGAVGGNDSSALTEISYMIAMVQARSASNPSLQTPVEIDARKMTRKP